MYLALYRKYRPQKFNEVIGQDKIITTLKNQILNDNIGHAYLFCGSRGTGKTSTAKIFARAINCAKPLPEGSPCGECENCKALSKENIDIFEIDAASNNGVDQIRDLREQVKYPPINGKYKVYIIDEVHMLSTSAFNALLKTLEEPPSFVVFILATTEVHKLPATILSRCMRFDFELVSTAELINHLAKICDENKISYEFQALNLIARAGEGSVRDMLSAADRCISFCNNNLTADGVASVLGVPSRESLFDLADYILTGETASALIKCDELLAGGKSPLVLSKDLISYFRDLLFCLEIPNDVQTYVVASSEMLEKMKVQALKSNFARVVSAIENLSLVESELRYSVQPRIVLEASLIKTMAASNLLERVEILEKKLQNLQENNEKMPKNIENLASSHILEDDNANQSVKLQSNTNAVVGPHPEEREKLIKSDKFDSQHCLGELLNHLRNEHALSLVAGLSQIKDVRANGDEIEFIFDDDDSVEMVLSNKNKHIIDEYMSAKGAKFRFVSKRQAAENSVPVRDLAKFFSGNLNVD